MAAAKIVDKCTEEELDDYIIEIDVLKDCKTNDKIVKYYETYYYDQKLWLLIEYCSGGAVDSLILDLDKSLNETQIHYICVELLDALIFLHETLYVIHRDIKAGL
jgi:serine/threonine-protein kinase 10